MAKLSKAETDTLISYITDYSSEPVPQAARLTIGGFLLDPPYEISIGKGRVIASSQILDGEEVFERVSKKSPTIKLSGSIFIADTLKSSQNMEQLLWVMAKFDYVFGDYNDILEVECQYLQNIGINWFLVKNSRVTPLAGAVGFEYSIDGAGVNYTREGLKQSLIAQ